MRIGYLAIGANLGDRIGAMRQALQGLRARRDLALAGASPVYETRAHTLFPHKKQPLYLNAVIEVRTTLDAEGLLGACRRLEQAAGREQRDRWMPRTLDMDILMLGEEERRAPGLTLPHPRLGQRRFVLQPWADLSPLRHVPPPFDATVADLLRRCPDADVCVRTALAWFTGQEREASIHAS